MDSERYIKHTTENNLLSLRSRKISYVNMYIHFSDIEFEF